MSWERTAFGFLLCGALVLLRQQGSLGPGRTMLALAATVLSVLVVGLGYRRSRQITAGSAVADGVEMPSPGPAVLVVGGATVGMSAALVVMVLHAL